MPPDHSARRHFFGLAHTKLLRLPDIPEGQVYELRMVGGDECVLGTWRFFSAEHIATLKPSTPPGSRRRLHQLAAKLDFRPSVVESNEPISQALYEEVTAYCLRESASHINLFLPPVEMLDVPFFKKLTSALSGNNTLRKAKLWLLENWEPKTFPDMTWKERYDAVPWNVRTAWRTVDAFKKCATDLGLPSRRSPGPKPRASDA